VAKFWAELKLAGTMVAFLAATGCHADWFSSPLAGVQSRTTSVSSERADLREIDAGIIFAGQASLVGYHQSPSRIEDALRLDFTPDKPMDGEHRPAHLAVEITLQLRSGNTQTRTVNVLETLPVVLAPTSVRGELDAKS
jgi:hypothetical protein